MNIEALEAEIKKLPAKERGALARSIIASLDELSESEIEAVWTEEAESRLDDLESGRVAGILADEVLARARAAIS